jgi:hypothetical protein
LWATPAVPSPDCFAITCPECHVTARGQLTTVERYALLFLEEEFRAAGISLVQKAPPLPTRDRLIPPPPSPAPRARYPSLYCSRYGRDTLLFGSRRKSEKGIASRRELNA